MTDMFLGLLMVLAAAILVVLIDVAIHLREVCRRLDHLEHLRLIPKVKGHVHSFKDGKEFCFAIWIFEKGTWSLLQPCGQKGCACGPSPTHHGAYEGEVIRKECPPPKSI